MEVHGSCTVISWHNFNTVLFQGIGKLEERKTGEQIVGGSVRTQRILVHTLSLTHVFFMCAA